jgi:hypothetical protein
MQESTTITPFFAVSSVTPVPSFPEHAQGAYLSAKRAHPSAGRRALLVRAADAFWALSAADAAARSSPPTAPVRASFSRRA